MHDISLAEACARFRRRVAAYLADKQAAVQQGTFGALDHFPCWYYVKYLDKMAGLQAIPAHPWASVQEPMAYPVPPGQ